MKHTLKWERSGVRFRPFYVRPVRLSHLLESQGSVYSFINLDVESLNLELFNEMHRLQVFASPTLRMLCVEHDGHRAYMQAAMATYGFTVAAQNPENLIFHRRLSV